MTIPAPPRTRSARHERLGRKPSLAVGFFIAGGLAVAAWLVLRIYYFNRWSDWSLRLLASPIPLFVLTASVFGVWLLFDLAALGALEEPELKRVHQRVRLGWRSLEHPHRRAARRAGLAALVVYLALFGLIGWLWVAWAWRLL
jgi:hypothetical protein